jgi:hypothetical protein
LDEKLQEICEPISVDDVYAVLDHVTTEIFPHRALARQQRYLRRVVKPEDMPIGTYVARIRELNGYLEDFPPFAPGQSLSEADLVELVERGLPNSWTEQMADQGFDPIEHTLTDLVAFCERAEVVATIVDGHHSKKSEGPRAEPSRVPVFKRTGALSHARKPSEEASNKKQKTGKYCPLQKTSGNDAGECKVILAPIARMRGTGKSQTTAARSNNNKKIEKQRESLMNEMLAQFKDTVAETVHESDDSSSDATDLNIDNFNTDSDDSFDAYTLSQLHSTSTGSTSTKDKNFAPLVVAKIQSHPQQPKVQWIRVLLDSGASGTIINGTYTKKINTQRVSKTEWTTKSGTFVTEKECKIHFSLPEFHENKIIEWTVHVDDTEQNFKYDMIIGRDLLEALGISFDFAKTYYHMG